MLNGRVNMIVDAFWGSSGKGKFAAYLADLYNIEISSASNTPNAGHTVKTDAWKRVFKCLPAATLGCKARFAILTGASVVDTNQIALEASWVPHISVLMHDRAALLRQEHKDFEMWAPSLTKIGSTRQGTAPAMIDKILRRPHAIIGDTAMPAPIQVSDGQQIRALLHTMLLDRNQAVLHEVSQGYALSIDHGSHYPQCTSRNCTTAKGLDDLGVSPRLLGDVYLNVRPYPIRVGHIMGDNHEILGHSGGFYPDCIETTWDHIGNAAGMPASEVALLRHRELTTVTQRLRRVCTFSEQGFRDAVRTNGATKILLNFAQYLDWSINKESGTHRIAALPSKVRDFVLYLQQISHCPVTHIGTGAKHNHVITIEDNQ